MLGRAVAVEVVVLGLGGGRRGNELLLLLLLLLLLQLLLLLLPLLTTYLEVDTHLEQDCTRRVVGGLAEG